jgi:hypothetical protein
MTSQKATLYHKAHPVSNGFQLISLEAGMLRIAK